MSTITGTPAVSGNFSFTIGLTDNANTTATADLSLLIGPAAIGDAFQLPSGDVGISYTHSLASMTASGFPPQLLLGYSSRLTPGRAYFR